MAATECKPARGLLLLGMVLAVVLLGGLAEGFLRAFPPRDLHPYLGDCSPLTGLFRPDHDFVVAYRSWDDFVRDNAARLLAYLPFHGGTDSRPIWALFGNSFIQAPGMLGDTARDTVRDRRFFYLGRNEPFLVRLAQIKLLLENGLAPERIVIELMPGDLTHLGEQPLDTLRVNPGGALVYEPRLPPEPAAALVRHSRLALTAWVRSKQHRGNPRFNKRDLYRHIDPILLADLDYLFGRLAGLTGNYGVPVTVLLIPSYHQVRKGAGWGFQDTLSSLLSRHGCDVCDPRDSFCRYANPDGLYLPDLHLSPTGNQLLLTQLLNHVQVVKGQGGYRGTNTGF